MAPQLDQRRRASVLVGCLALTLVGTSASGAVGDRSPSDAAVSWLQGQAGDDGVLTHPAEGDAEPAVDHATTIEAALAESLLGHDDAARAYAEELEPHIGDHLVDGPAYAATLVLVTATGLDPREFGTFDLITATEGALAAEGPASGRLDGADLVGQALAVRGLASAGSELAAPALDYLLSRQCGDGGFPLETSHPDVDQPCVGDTATTAAVLALLGGDGFGTATGAWAARAADHLAGAQSAGGGFLDGGVVSARTTALAARALAASCRIVPAQTASAVLRSLQVPDATAESAPAADSGAVAPSPDALASATEAGVAAPDAEAWRSATAQSAPALRWLPGRTGGLRVDATRTYVRARSLQLLTVSGATTGSSFCLDGPSVTGLRTAPAETERIEVRMPSGTGDHAYTVSAGSGSHRAVLRVLGPAKLKVSAPRRREVGSTMRIRVRGLASGERATLRVRRGDVRRTWANRQGLATFSDVDVVRKPGKRRYVVRGKFGGIRRGSDVVTVVAPR